MKAKNILMTLLLVTGAIAAKASGYPAELALVSQPVMVYNANAITVYYDVENIGDYTYRGSVYIYLSPDEGYYYADEWIKVRPGHIKRIAIDIPAYRIRKGHPFTIMPYYEVGDVLYSFTTFEYFEPLTFFWEGPRNERWVVIEIGPCVRYYTRPGTYRYYYDGYRPPMPPPPGHGHGTPPPPMDPKHHTYGYHKDHGGYPTDHHGEAPKPHDSDGATVRPNSSAGSMSGGYSSGNNGGNGGGNNNGSSSGNSSTTRPSSGTSSGSSNVSRPSSSSTTTSGTSRPSSGTSTSSSSGERKSSSTTTSGTSRPSSGTSNGSSTVSRPSSSSTSGTSRPSSGTSTSSSGERKSNSSVNRSNSSSSGSGSSTRSGSSSTRKSNTSSSTRSSSTSGSSSVRK